MLECVAEPVAVVACRQMFAEPFGSVLEYVVLDMVDFVFTLDLTCLGVDNHWGDGTVFARIGELVEYVMLVLDNGTSERNVAAPEDMERCASRNVYAHPVGDVIGVMPDGIAGVQEHIFWIIERMDIGLCVFIGPVLLLAQTVVPSGVYINPY